MVVLDHVNIDLRQFRAISLSATGVRAGERVSAAFYLMPFYPDLCTDEFPFEASLKVGDAEIASKEARLRYGETVLVVWRARPRRPARSG